VVGGGAVALAADDIGAKLRAIAAGMLQVGREEIELRAGFALIADPSKALPLTVVANAPTRSDMSLRRTSNPRWSPPNLQDAKRTPDSDDKGRYSMYTTFSNGVYISVIELCTETGVVEILDHVIVHDCGTQVNPLFVEGQVRGGVVMGVARLLRGDYLRLDRPPDQRWL